MKHQAKEGGSEVRNFFSFVGDGSGNYKYFDWEYRKDHIDGNCDSHTAILTENEVPPKACGLACGLMVVHFLISTINMIVAHVLNFGSAV